MSANLKIFNEPVKSELGPVGETTFPCEHPLSSPREHVEIVQRADGRVCFSTLEDDSYTELFITTPEKLQELISTLQQAHRYMLKVQRDDGSEGAAA